MTPGHGVTGALELALRQMRESRFANGLACVHCRSVHVQRWGSFSGRQRYRCVACRRTFSDLTLTPMAYSKLPWLWGAFGQCMLDSLTVRAAAARLGIHKDTAWRWRHCLLKAHRKLRLPSLRGIIEVGEVALSVNVRSPQRVCGARWLPRRGRRRVPIIIARDRGGTTRTGVASGRRPTLRDLRSVIGRSRARGRVVVSHDGRYGPAARYALISGAQFRHVSAGGMWFCGTALEHIGSVLEYGVRFRGWLARFRGIAAKYLEHYLVWHLIVNRVLSSGSAFVLATLRLPALLRK